MRRLAHIVSWCTALVLLAAVPASGCGDKVLALGRALRLRYVAKHSASILLYLPPGTAASAATSETSLQTALTTSSKVLRVVKDGPQLSQALQAGKYDLLVTDPGDAPDIEQQLQSMSLHTVVVPLLYKGSKAQVKELAKHYHVILKAPSKTDSYFLALDEAMEIKAKRDEVKVLAKK